MKKISIYVRNHNSGPSCYYRVYQYFKNNDAKEYDVLCHDLMSDFMFKINMSIRSGMLRYIAMGVLYLSMVFRMLLFILNDFIRKPDVIIVSRTTIPRRTPLFIRPLLRRLYRNSKVIWDFDDNIIYAKEISVFEKNLLLEYSDNIIVTNEFLKNTLPDEHKSKVILLPTTDGDFSGINIKKSIQFRKKQLKSEVDIVWSGTSSNLDNVERIIPAIERFAKQSLVKVNLYVVCNMPFKYKTQCNNLNIISLKWSRKKAVKCISRCHVGIMPLLDNEFTRGKGGFKLIQYMAAGVPVVASPVGFNLEIVKDEFGMLSSDEDFCYSLKTILDDHDKWADMAVASYKEYVNRYSYEDHLGVIKKIL